MTLRCVWEHNGKDSLLYFPAFPGAYVRGADFAEAKAKIPFELASYCAWRQIPPVAAEEISVVQDAPCTLAVSDADSDVLFAAEKQPLTREEYEELKTLALKSAADFLSLYNAIPEKDRSLRAPRQTFYGAVPASGEETYFHTKNVNAYYFGEIGIAADNEGDILTCRQRGFARLEETEGFLENPVFVGSYGESWTLRKVLRRFLWHDRIHAKALYRRAVKVWGEDIPDVFCFGGGFNP